MRKSTDLYSGSAAGWGLCIIPKLAVEVRTEWQAARKVKNIAFKRALSQFEG